MYECECVVCVCEYACGWYGVGLCGCVWCGVCVHGVYMCVCMRVMGVSVGVSVAWRRVLGSARPHYQPGCGLPASSPAQASGFVVMFVLAAGADRDTRCLPRCTWLAAPAHCCPSCCHRLAGTPQLPSDAWGAGLSAFWQGWRSPSGAAPAGSARCHQVGAGARGRLSQP